MKILVIGDIVVAEDLFIDALGNEEFFKNYEIETIHWPAKDRKNFQQKALNIEKNGPDAEAIPDEVYEKVKDCDILLTHFCPINSKVIENGKNLKLIGTCRGGMEHVDVSAATNRGIPVIHVIRNAEATSDYTIGLMLAETRNIARSFKAIKEGEWRKQYVNSSYTTSMKDMQVGIVGFGHIGKLVAKKVLGFGSKVVAYDPFVSQEKINESGLNVELVSREELFKSSDIVSLHLRATPETENSINKEVFDLMKPSAYLINTSRARVVNKEDFVNALKSKQIGGAALDVLWEEPINSNEELLALDNVTITAHDAGNVIDALPKSPRLLINTIVDFYKNNNIEMIVNKTTLN